MKDTLKQKKILFALLFFSIVFFKLMLIFVIDQKVQNALRGRRTEIAQSQNIHSSTPEKKAEKLEFDLVKEHVHASEIFVEGTEFIDGKLYESGGLYEKSGIYINNGDKTTKVTDVDSDIFAEGLTYLNGFLYQLTWKEKKILVYTLDNLSKPITELTWNGGEGWGATNDGEHLIVSNGTDTTSFLKITLDEKGLPNGYEIRKKINVKWDGEAVKNINELEFIDGKIWANVWLSNNIIVINPETGEVERYLDASYLAKSIGLMEGEREKTLNGIAKNLETGSIFLTGKFWPIMFEIKIK